MNRLIPLYTPLFFDWTISLNQQVYNFLTWFGPRTLRRSLPEGASESRDAWPAGRW